VLQSCILKVLVHDTCQQWRGKYQYLFQAQLATHQRKSRSQALLSVVAEGFVCISDPPPCSIYESFRRTERIDTMQFHLRESKGHKYNMSTSRVEVSLSSLRPEENATLPTASFCSFSPQYSVLSPTSRFGHRRSTCDPCVWTIRR
jgi:hypothetical protein